MTEIGFEISTSARDDGTIEAVYIHFTHNPVAKTKQIQGDILLADFDKDGKVVGLEILAPVRISDLTRLVEPARRTPFESLLQRAYPPELVHA